jgi:hypothetical protein
MTLWLPCTIDLDLLVLERVTPWKSQSWRVDRGMMLRPLLLSILYLSLLITWCPSRTLIFPQWRASSWFSTYSLCHVTSPPHPVLTSFMVQPPGLLSPQSSTSHSALTSSFSCVSHSFLYLPTDHLAIECCPQFRLIACSFSPVDCKRHKILGLS